MRWFERFLKPNQTLEALNSRIWSESLNDMYIAFIPKTKTPSKATEYIPISLCNVFYKIIAKELANILKSLLLDIISLTQSAFVPDKLITNNVIVAFESMHTVKTKM